MLITSVAFPIKHEPYSNAILCGALVLEQPNMSKQPYLHLYANSLD
jgi:hypothetical protein